MEIAVIGFSFNIPGAQKDKEFDFLMNSAKDALRKKTTLKQKNFISDAGYITNENEFDYKLFEISLRDCLIIEPQQRLFIQQCWMALENAGYNPQFTKNRVGIFSSSSDSNYNKYLKESNVNLSKYDPFELEIGINKEQQSLRTAFLLNFSGPAMGIQSACSSGLLNVHIAMQSLSFGECEIALVGASSLPYPLHTGYEFRPGMNLSQKGKIFSFDYQADGMVPGFGCIVIVLKPYAQALKDKDYIYAKILSSSVNNDGRSKAFFTSLSSEKISENIRIALEKSQSDLSNINFIEAHGSGTKIGDVLEAAAFKNVFSLITNERESIAVSSIKSTIGHLDVVAGLAGLLKSVFQVWLNKIYPASNFTQLNNNISFKNTPFYVPTKHIDYPELIGIVNSIGIGGTNCALVISHTKNQYSEINQINQKLAIFIGSNSIERLETFLTELIQQLNHSKHDFLNLAYTLSRRALGKKYIVKFQAKDICGLIIEIKESLIKGVTTNNSDINLNKFLGHATNLGVSEIDFTLNVQIPNVSLKNDENNNIENILRTIWVDNLLVKTIHSNDSFIKLGGHSILALSLLDEIKNKLGISLSIDWFFQHDIFSDQVSSLIECKQSKSNDLFKKIRSGSNNPEARIIFIHASVSGSEVYYNLSQLINPKIEIWAINSYNLSSDKDKRISSISELANYYAKIILSQKLDPSTPIIIGGWSLGGILANTLCNELSFSLNIQGTFAIDSVCYAPSYEPLFSKENTQYFIDVEKMGLRSINASEKQKSLLNELFDIEKNMVKSFQEYIISYPMLNIVATKPRKKINQTELWKLFCKLKKTNNWNASPNIEYHFVDTNHTDIIGIHWAGQIASLINKFIKYSCTNI